MHDPATEPPTPADLAAIAGRVAREAAGTVALMLGSARRVGTKSSATDVVTEADLASEALIRRLLAEVTPDSGVLGEEQGAASAGQRLQWVVDPLDGTVNFAYGVPIFAISIAAAVDGDLVAGAVIDVGRGELFTASTGAGARLDGEPIGVTSCTHLSQALVATGFSYRAELRSTQGSIVAALLPAARDVRCFGSAALELCWVAAGRVDGYYERDTKLWDHAAGSVIAAEAGAVTELPCPENDGLMIAAAPGIFEQLRLMVEPMTPQRPSSRHG